MEGSLKGEGISYMTSLCTRQTLALAGFCRTCKRSNIYFLRLYFKFQNPVFRVDTRSITSLFYYSYLRSSSSRINRQQKKNLWLGVTQQGLSYYKISLNITTKLITHYKTAGFIFFNNSLNNKISPDSWHVRRALLCISHRSSLIKFLVFNR